MDPQKDSHLSQSLNEEAASAEMPAVLVAGQKIEPQSPAVSADPSNVPTAAGMPNTSAPQDTSVEPPSAPDAPAGPAPIAPIKHRKKGWLVGILIAAVILLLSGTAAAGYYLYYLPNKPENVLLQALAYSFDPAKVKSAHFDGSITADDDGNRYSFAFNGAASAETNAASASITVDGSGEMDGSIDLRAIDGSLFLKIDSKTGAAESQTSQSLYASLLGSIAGQWFEIDRSTLEGFSGEAAESTLGASDRQKIVDAYSQHRFITLQQKLPDATIEGAASYHFVLGINKTELKAFAAALKVANIEAIKFTDKDLQNFNSALDEVNLNDLGLEAWIAKKDRLFTQLSAKMSKNGATINVQVTMSKYNQPVEVEKPSGAKSVQELLGNLFSDTVESNLTLPELEQEIPGGISL